MNKIKVIIKQPGQKPYTTHISGTLENLQKTVGGYIEVIRIGVGMVVLCDEDGKGKNLPYSCTISEIPLVGTVIFAGSKDGEFTDFPIELKAFKRLFPRIFEEVAP